ncbi:hypothetical protein OE88DRAFT_1145685 [Heliocybe sulcata]|uniref:Uncharacterized protein n=1 Tax=Heliocybe sulcata TaxID=5364 RepID=A0A5C3NB05_9AGAM|nr:hypothetical protein OE88DRAFT_1145685 [Heliocybe sulcata]
MLWVRLAGRIVNCGYASSSDAASSATLCSSPSTHGSVLASFQAGIWTMRPLSAMHTRECESCVSGEKRPIQFSCPIHTVACSSEHRAAFLSWIEKQYSIIDFIRAIGDCGHSILGSISTRRLRKWASLAESSNGNKSKKTQGKQSSRSNISTVECSPRVPTQVYSLHSGRRLQVAPSSSHFSGQAGRYWSCQRLCRWNPLAVQESLHTLASFGVFRASRGHPAPEEPAIPDGHCNIPGCRTNR